MNRYLLFGGEDYYPNGGWNDFIESFEFLTIAIATAQELADRKKADPGNNNGVSWWHIVDIGIFPPEVIERYEGLERFTTSSSADDTCYFCGKHGNEARLTSITVAGIESHPTWCCSICMGV